MATFRDAAALSDLSPGRSIEVQIDGLSVALFNVGGTIRAVSAECTHAGGPMCEGEVEAGVVTCPWHAATFSLADGKALTRPATLGLESYPTRVVGGRIEVELP
jgi:nitrite reductase/ring-hydroxylating ferredoxin subunit